MLEVPQEERALLDSRQPDTFSVGNLALLLQAHGKLDETNCLCWICWRPCAQACPKHPSTLTSMVNLAFLLQSRTRTHRAGRPGKV